MPYTSLYIYLSQDSFRINCHPNIVQYYLIKWNCKLVSLLTIIDNSNMNQRDQNSYHAVLYCSVPRRWVISLVATRRSTTVDPKAGQSSWRPAGIDHRISSSKFLRKLLQIDILNCKVSDMNWPEHRGCKQSSVDWLAAAIYTVKLMLIIIANYPFPTSNQ